MSMTLYVLAAIYLVGGIICFVDFITKVCYPVHLSSDTGKTWLTIKRTEKPVFGFTQAFCMAAIWPYGAFYLRRKYAGYAWFGPGWPGVRRRLTSGDLRKHKRSWEV